MSAIAAIFNLYGAPVNEQALRSMTDAVAHRGPDGIGIWSLSSVGLGACLLKTTPEADFEKLPLVTDDGRYAIAMDGRIDNRTELAKALNVEAAVLPTVPDSALVMSAYRKWGKACLDRIAGDFAFAIWDSAQQEVFCGRDPLGIRMLHYYCDGKRFIAATEVSQILKLVDSELDERSVALFLDVRSAPSDSTFMKGIKKLPGGCSLTVSESGANPEVYWNPDPSDLLELSDDREYEERFLELFKDSVGSRMRSRGPVAVSLSGGMDSSSVLAIGEHMRRTDSPELPELRFYSNVYGDMEAVDESEYIRATLEMHDTPGKMIESGSFDDASLGSSPLGLKRAEPYIAPHEESHRRLFAEVKRDGIRSFMTGLGGDEVFTVAGGYLADLFRTFDLRGIKRERRYFNRRAWFGAMGDALNSVLPFIGRESEPPIIDWLSDSGRQSMLSATEDEWLGERSFKSRHVRDVEGWIQMRGGLAGYTWTDVTVAEYEIEARHPFLDRRLAEFLISVPANVKFRYGYNKRVLRRAMKGILPEAVRSRRYKTDFSSLFDAKATQGEADEISEFMRSPKLAEMGLVEPEPLREAWNDYLRSANEVDNERRTALWAAITLEQWLREYLVDDGNENEIGAFSSQRSSKLFTATVS